MEMKTLTWQTKIGKNVEISDRNNGVFKHHQICLPPSQLFPYPDLHGMPGGILGQPGVGYFGAMAARGVASPAGIVPI